MLSSSKAICQFYKSSRGCKFGTSCRFLHSIPQEISIESQNQDGNLNTKTENSSLQAVTNIHSEVHKEKQQNEAVREVSEIKKDLTDKHLKVCHYFYEYGNCKFGTKCRFVHTDEVQQVEPSIREGGTIDDLACTSNEGIEPDNLQASTLKSRKDVKRKPRKKPICHFYKSGHCRNGDNCKYRHVEKNVNVGSDLEIQDSERKQQDESLLEISGKEDSTTNVLNTEGIISKPLINTRSLIRELTRDSAKDEEIEKLRSTELQQLKKRFTKEKLKCLPKIDDEDIFELTFSSSDPDWPYDVKLFELEISFPKKYPLQTLKICLPKEQNLPETVRRYVEVSIQEWIEEKEKENVKRNVIVMVFRPFIKWLDRNLESIVTEGLKQLQRELIAKAAGLEFIPASQLKKEAGSSPLDGSIDETGSDTEQEEIKFTVYKKDEMEEVYTGPTDYKSEGSSDEYETLEDQNTKKDLDLTETAIRGTEIRLRNLQLRESASTMVFQQLKLMIQCSRCHNRMELKTPPNQVNAISCQKCNQSQLVNFRAAMVHQFSSIIGYLDLEGCTAFDLAMQDCNFKLGCLGCSKDTYVQGLPPGQLIDVSCHTCHQKMKTAADSAKFTELQASTVSQDNAVNIPVMRIKKIPKDPRIMLGSPLPDNGTCKHYRKSFRWFRFPCCGNCHPCDICHEDKENHEMVRANRMICGHCCKEQPFALEKPCVACHRLMTKSRSSFWEGGKGCRDKVKMNRDDVKKYKNTNKTISKKAQEKMKPAKKKENK